MSAANRLITRRHDTSSRRATRQDLTRGSMNTLFTPKCFRLTSAHFFHIRRNASFIDTKWWHSFKRKKRSESPDHWASSLEMRSTPTHTSCLTQKATQKVYFIICVCRWWFNQSFYDRCLQPNASVPQCVFYMSMFCALHRLLLWFDRLCSRTHDNSSWGQTHQPGD